MRSGAATFALGKHAKGVCEGGMRASLHGHALADEARVVMWGTAGSREASKVKDSFTLIVSIRTYLDT